jgi:hypothetical protein
VDGGTVELICLRDAADAGQNALRAALVADGGLSFSLKVELNDKPVPTGKNTFFYAKVVVLGAKNGFGDGGEISTTTFTLGIDGEIFEVPAAAT